LLDPAVVDDDSAVEYRILPYEMIGPIRLGMSVRNARAALAEPLRALGKGWAIAQSFLKDSGQDCLPTDDFFDVGFHIYYRIEGARLVVDAVEVFPPANPTLDGFPLLTKSYGVARDFLRLRDPSLEVELDGAKSTKLGLSLYDPTCGEEPEQPAASLLVFSAGYWERP
jgi:hypothetical protein